MKKIDYIVLSMVEPTDKNTVWAYPVGNGLVSLRVFNNGGWVSTDKTIDLTPYLKTADAQSTYATKTELTAHTGNTSNPHNVTKAQVGLSNVDNTSDLDKPVSTATQDALDLKQNVTDNSFSTSAKTVVGAVNEIVSKLPVYTVVPELTADYEIPANPTSVEHAYEITVGSTVHSITFDLSISWVSGISPITAASHKYIISVVNNIGVWGEV